MTFDSREKSGKGSFVRSSFRAAGKLTNTIAGPLGNTDKRCCKCRFAIKHTSATIAFHQQLWISGSQKNLGIIEFIPIFRYEGYGARAKQWKYPDKFWLPSKVAAIWQRKGKTHQIRNARDFVSNPSDPYQGTVHFFNPAERTYEYVLFETGFTLKTSSDQFFKKPWKLSLYGMNESAPKQKQVKALGSAEVELSPYAFEAFASPRTMTSAGTTSSSASSSSDSASSRLLRVELEPKSEKVKTASLDIEISCTILSDDFFIDDDDFSDAASTSCGGSTNEGDLASITGSDLFGPLETNSSTMSSYTTVSPMVNARLTRMQTLSSSDLKQKGENSGSKLSKRFSFSSRSFKTKRNLSGGEMSSSLYPPPHLLRAANDRNDKHRTASLSPAKDNRIHYHLPPLSTSSQVQKKSSDDDEINTSATDGADTAAGLSQAAKNKRTTGATVMGITLEENNSTADSVDESLLKTPINPESMSEEVVCNGKTATSPLVGDTETLNQTSTAKEGNVPVSCFNPQSRNLPSVILESLAENQPEIELDSEPIVIAPEASDQNGVSDCNNANVLLNQSTCESEPHPTPESPKEVTECELSFPSTGAANYEESSAAEVRENNHEVKDHPLSPKADGAPGQTKFNPFLCDNADDTPFTSAEMNKEKLDADELTKQRNFESWVAEVIKGYPRVGQSGAYIVTGSISASSNEVASEEDQMSMQLTCGITLCAVLHRFNPQLIGNFNWLLEENDTESDRYFKLALSTCEIVDIPVKDCTSKDTLEILKRIHTKYEKLPVPAMPNLGDLGFTEQIELDELERTECIRRKVNERSTTKDATNKRMSKFARRTTTLTMQPAETVETSVAPLNLELQPTCSTSNTTQINNIGSQVTASSQKAINNSKSFAAIISTTTTSSASCTMKSESTKSIFQSRLAQNASKIESGSKIKTKIEESSPVKSSNLFSNNQQPQTQQQQQSQHQQKPIVMLDESDVGPHNGTVASSSLQPKGTTDPSLMSENGATDLVESEESRKKDGATPPDDNDNLEGAHFESEQAMCESLRRNWRKMVASKRDVLKNRVVEIDVELNKIRSEMMQLTNEDDILSSSKEMANLTNEKSELILEFDDIEIMEEDLDLQEKCDQIKTQLQLLQLNTELSGTAEKEAEEKRLLEIFYKFMDERNELVEKVDNRRREQIDADDDSDSKQYIARLKSSEMSLVQEYFHRTAKTRQKRISYIFQRNGHHTGGTENVINKCGVM